MTSFARQIGRQIIDNSVTRGRPMTEDESHTLLGTMMFRGDIETLHADMLSMHPIYAIMHHRIEVMFGGDIDPLAKTFVSALTNGNPGNAVLYAAVLCELSDGGKRRVELKDIVDAFPLNVPSSGVLEAAWDSQKGGVGPASPDGRAYDNALDDKWAWTE